MPERKHPKKVLTISGNEPEPDVIDDIDCEIIADLQAEAWKAEKKVQRAIAQIEMRIKHGARFAAKHWYFDSELGMVRSKKSPSRQGSAKKKQEVASE